MKEPVIGTVELKFSGPRRVMEEFVQALDTWLHVNADQFPETVFSRCRFRGDDGVE